MSAKIIPLKPSPLDALNQNIAANQGVSFDTLRRIKTDMQTAARGGDHVSGLVADTLRDALGDHLNTVAPDLGQRYADAVGQYKQAMDLRRSFTGAKGQRVRQHRQARRSILSCSTINSFELSTVFLLKSLCAASRWDKRSPRAFLNCRCGVASNRQVPPNESPG